MRENARELLVEIASGLLEECERVPAILERGVATKDDLVAKYVLAQGVNRAEDFQLPEPILHPIDHPAVLVVGFNPNYGADEDIPRFGSSLADYVAFYADRFAPDRRDAKGWPSGRRLDTGATNGIRHYQDVESMITEVFNTDAAFGLNAVYVDAFPWKWKQGEGPRIDKADGAYAYERLKRIVLTLLPKVVLTLGAPSARVVGEWASGAVHVGGTNGEWPTVHVASYHPAARGGMFEKHRFAVQEALRRALVG